MLTKFNDSNDMNALASDAIHSYIKDGYRIDAKESVIDKDKDKNCTFKAALVKDVDGVICKVVITLTDEVRDGCHSLMYNKVDYVDDLKWSEESRGFSTLCKHYSATKEDVDNNKKLLERAFAAKPLSDKLNEDRDEKSDKELHTKTKKHCRKRASFSSVHDYIRDSKDNKDKEVKLHTKVYGDDDYLIDLVRRILSC